MFASELWIGTVVDVNGEQVCGVMVNRGGIRGHKYWAGRGKIL